MESIRGSGGVTASDLSNSRRVDVRLPTRRLTATEFALPPIHSRAADDAPLGVAVPKYDNVLR